MDFASGCQCFMGRWSERLAGPVLDFCGAGEREVVLDVGCGLGSLARAVLTRTGTTVVTGVDRRRETVAAARLRAGGRRAAYLAGAADGPRAFTARAWGVRGIRC